MSTKPPTYVLDHPEIRDSVTRLCEGFPGEYWRKCDREQAYPHEFVDALTQAGFLSALIPEEFDGSGLPLSAGAAILEEVHRSGGNAGACHAQMYTMGTLLRHGSQSQKQQYLPPIARGELRLQAFGVTEPTSGTDTTALRTTARREGEHYVVNGQKIWTSRAQYSDLMILLCRTTPREQVEKKTHGLSVLLVDMREARDKTLTIRPIRTMMNHATTEIFFDDMRVPVDNLIGEEGQGFRYILSGMNAERILIASECIGDAKWFIEKATAYASRSVLSLAGPLARIRGYSFLSPGPMPRCVRQSWCCERQSGFTMRARIRARRPILPRCWLRMLPGPQQRCACRLMAALDLPKNMTWSANSARPACTRLPRSRLI